MISFLEKLIQRAIGIHRYMGGHFKMKRFFTIVFAVLMTTISSFNIYAGGDPSCVGIGCDSHGAGIESLSRLIMANPRGPFGLLNAMGAVMSPVVGAIERGWAAWVDINVPGASKSPNVAEHLLFEVGEFTTTQAALSLIPLAGRGGGIAATNLAGKWSLGALERRVGPEATRILEIVSGGRGPGYREGLKAWEHFHVKGGTWETYKGPMVEVFRGQEKVTQEILSQSARVGGIEETLAQIEGFSGATPEQVQALFKVWQTHIQGRIPTVATAAEMAFAENYPAAQIGAVTTETSNFIWETVSNPQSVLYTLKVPTALTLRPVSWWAGATEIPVVHRIAPGMIRSVEGLPPREVIINLFKKGISKPLIWDGQGVAGPFAP